MFGRGLRPRDRRVMGWSCLCLGYKWGVCFWGTQLGALIHESLKFLYGLSMVLHRSKNWKLEDDEMELIAQLLLEIRIGAYIEWLDNKLIMTANNKHT